MESTVTDRIQTIAVIIGISFGIWEFVLHDREAELAKKVFISDMILSRSSEAMVDSIIALSEIEKALSDGDAINLVSAISFNSKLLPLKNHFDGWGFCYENQLCDEELAVKYICNDLSEFDSIITKYAATLSAEKSSKDYSTLLKACKAGPAQSF